MTNGMTFFGGNGMIFSLREQDDSQDENTGGITG